MATVRLVQTIAIILLLCAGYLWSQRLGLQSFQRSQQQIIDNSSEQLEIVRQKVEEKKDAIELVEFGRKFLKSGNARFAIIPLERATQLKPEYRDAWYLLGYAYAQLANEVTNLAEIDKRQSYLTEAIKALQQAKTIDAGHQPTLDLLQQLAPIQY